MPDEALKVGDSVGPWVVVRPLGDAAWLGEDQGQQVVIKRLDGSCVRGNKLRDGVRERLHRIRQLPQVSMANLLGVEQTHAGSWCVWEHVPGQTLEQWMHQADEPEQIRMGREVVLAVMGMHALGIVHGAIHERNIIVCGRMPRLIHASALLWNDTESDAQAVMQMLRRCVRHGIASQPAGAGDGVARRDVQMAALEKSVQTTALRPEVETAALHQVKETTSSRMGRWLDQAEQEQWSLADLGRRLMSAGPENVDEADAEPAAAGDRWLRLRAGMAMVAVIALGAALSLGVWRWGIGTDGRAGSGAPEHRAPQVIDRQQPTEGLSQPGTEAGEAEPSPGAVEASPGQAGGR